MTATATPREKRGTTPTDGSAAEVAEGRAAAVADGSTFAPALALLEPAVRSDVETLYRVLRTLDDLVDEDDPRATQRVQGVERWAQGEEPPRTPESRALAGLEHGRRLPRRELLDFCAGMRHDIAREKIETDEDFDRYCHQAGGAVGIVLANLLGADGIAEADAQRDADRPSEAKGAREPRRLSEAEIRMETLGRAMQVTNIARDIDEDLAHSRLYIPASMIERHGFPTPGKREALLRELITRADTLYEQGAGAIPLLHSGRRAMALAAKLYREILREIERGFGDDHELGGVRG